MAYDIAEVELIIHQPRYGEGISRWVTSVDEIKEFGKKAHKVAQSIALYQMNEVQSNTLIIPGEKQCSYCPGRKVGICDAFNKYAMKTLIDDFDVVDENLPMKVKESIPSVNGMDNEQLSTVYGQLDMLKLFIKTVENQVFMRLSNGDKIPGFKLVKGKAGNRAWVDEKKAERGLKDVLTLGQMYSKSLISVAQAEKIVKKANPEKWAGIAESLVVKPEGKPTVVSADDAREAITVNALDDFDVVEE